MDEAAAPAQGEQARFVEAGRQLFARPWAFVRGVRTLSDLPPPEAPEIAIAGRSNVGKSSLVNALTGQKALARTSNTPGRTQELNLFASDTPLLLVDMPGYGYAEAPKAAVAAWTRLVHAYLRGRPNLARVYVLVDARHGLKVVDREVLDSLDRAAVSYQVVLTKADKPKAGELHRVMAAVEAELARRPAAYPEVIATSSLRGSGIEALRAAIARLAAERGIDLPD